MDGALKKVAQILDNTRAPLLPEQVNHVYDDKYLLAEAMTHLALGAGVNVLAHLGVTEEQLMTLVGWAKARSVTLRLAATEKCAFLREEKRDIEGPKHTTSMGRLITLFSTKEITRVTDFIFKFSWDYQLSFFRGSDPANPILLLSRSSSTELTSASARPPFPEVYLPPSIDLDLTWLFRHLSSPSPDSPFRSSFQVDRSLPECRTPRRNPDVFAALIQFAALSAFCSSLSAYISSILSRQQDRSALPMDALTPATTLRGPDGQSFPNPQPFNPVVPLFEESFRATLPPAPPPSSSTSPAVTSASTIPSVPSLVIHSVSSSGGPAASAPQTESPSKSPRGLFSRVKSPRKEFTQEALTVHQTPSETPAAPASSSSSSNPKSPRKIPSITNLMSFRRLKSPRSGGQSSSVDVIEEDEEEEDQQTAQAQTGGETSVAPSSSSSSSAPTFAPTHFVSTFAMEHSSAVLLSPSDFAGFLAEQHRSLESKGQQLAQLFPSHDRLVTVAEARLVMLADHGVDLCANYRDSINYVEQMLYDQLFKAIGRRVSPADFSAYMEFHTPRVLLPPYQLSRFAVAVRQPSHAPQGVVAIEAAPIAGGDARPAFTMTRRVAQTLPILFPLHGSAFASFRGDRFLHAWVGQEFEGESGVALSLTARARQFSSFILMIGRMHSPTLFHPEHAIIIKNKDDLKVPLLLNTIPSAQEFKQATESMSPEQQAFAQAYRSMQLESTLFAVCTLQIKPQLEKLLCLPSDSLSKEIELTQDLLNLFIKFQIPSDLLKFDGDPSLPAGAKVDAVRASAKGIYDIVASLKEEQCRELESRVQQILLERHHLQDQLLGSCLGDGEVFKKCDGFEKKHTKSKRRVPVKRVMQERRKNEESKPNKKQMKDKFKTDKRKQSSSSSDAPLHTNDEQQQQQQQPQPPSEAADPNASSASPPEAPSVEVPEVVHGHALASEPEEEAFDFTAVPGRLDEMCLSLDSAGDLRPTIISVAQSWTLTGQETVLAQPQTKVLGVAEQKAARDVAFDLIDSLSRSGTLAFDEGSLHVVVGCSHQFDKSITDTVVQDNVNPIQKVERSYLIVASAIHELPTGAMLKKDVVQRVTHDHPVLFPNQDQK
ncbi:MAG: hypothetical protein Q8P67_09120 [archaeon]|nr:hypothetical protein [archaeon]